MNIGKEIEAYRSVVNVSIEIHCPDRNKLPGILRWPVYTITRLPAEFEGAVMFLVERLKDRNPPEAILRENRDFLKELRRK